MCRWRDESLPWVVAKARPPALAALQRWAPSLCVLAPLHPARGAHRACPPLHLPHPQDPAVSEWLSKYTSGMDLYVDLLHGESPSPRLACLASVVSRRAPMPPAPLPSTLLRFLWASAAAGAVPSCLGCTPRLPSHRPPLLSSPPPALLCSA